MTGSEGLKISSGFPSFDEYCLEVLRMTGPFPVPPESIRKSTPDNKVHINLEFKYNIYRRKQFKHHKGL